VGPASSFLPGSRDDTGARPQPPPGRERWHGLAAAQQDSAGDGWSWGGLPAAGKDPDRGFPPRWRTPGRQGRSGIGEQDPHRCGHLLELGSASAAACPARSGISGSRRLMG